MADHSAAYSLQGSDGAPTTGVPATVVEKRAHKEQPRIRRRNRLITSCLECRRRKLKCDKQQPCTNCTKFARDCVFLAPALDPAGQAKLAEVKERMGMLERTLEEDVARKSSLKSIPNLGTLTSPLLPGQEETYSDQEDPEDVKDLETTKETVEDAVYYEEDGNDELVDLGVSMGKLRLNERVGGLVRPRFSEELKQALRDLPKSDIPNPLANKEPSAWMAPGRDYVAPASSFLFAPGVEKSSLLTHLPAKPLVDKLMVHYWRAVHVIARTVHRPSFERRYERFWKDIAAGFEPPISFQAVLMAVLLSSVISMSDEDVSAEFFVTKSGLVDNFREGTESALARANLLRTTKLETLQAFVIYLIPLCRSEVSRAHSALTGTCIRLAECMGLHRDPSNYSSSPVETQVRRLIWFQICFLDLRTCEATGPRPQIRREDYDTKFPLNIDDVDLEKEGTNSIQEDAKHFTDMTISRMRFECLEMQRLLWIERTKMERKQTTLTTILAKIHSFRKAMEEKYLPMMNTSNALHVLAMEVYGILSGKHYISVMQLYASDDRRKMPERLRQMLISTCVTVTEHCMVIEQTPALGVWSWYIGALHQYHAALLMLGEMYAVKPDPVVEFRVWRCLDFVFDLPADIPKLEKSRMVLEEMAGRTELYASMRRLRMPTSMKPIGRRVKDTSRPSYLQQEQDQQRPTLGAFDRERSSSTLSSISNSGSNNGSTFRSLDASLQSQQQQANMDFRFGGNLGSASLNSIPMASAEQNLASFGGMAGLQGQQEQQGMSPSPGNYSDTSSSNVPIVYRANSTGSSPMDAITDVDWTEFDHLFGPTDMSTGDIMIPPFSFPQFSGQDLQCPSAEGM